MFTSRSEYRISLRSDNADTRLTEKGWQAGAVKDERWLAYQTTKNQMDDTVALLDDVKLSPNEWSKMGIPVALDGIKRR